MVRAILEGRKTQTRRIIKPGLAPDGFSESGEPYWVKGYTGSGAEMAQHAPLEKLLAKCPYGQGR